MQNLTISIVQTELAWEDANANLNHFERLLEGIKEPTDLIILPEMFNTGFTMNTKENAEITEGKSMQWMASIAKHKSCVICGSMIIQEEGLYYNRLIWMRSDGNYSFYNKKHLFRMGEEHLHYTAGKKQLIVELKGWKIMPLICYDLRFPVWSKNKFSNKEYNYDLLLYLANWPAARSTAWTSLIRARAIENMAYAAGINRIGSDGRGYIYSGDSLIVAADGKIILQENSGHESISTTRLNASELAEIRNKLGVGNDWDKFEIH